MCVSGCKAFRAVYYSARETVACPYSSKIQDNPKLHPQNAFSSPSVAFFRFLLIFVKACNIVIVLSAFEDWNASRTSPTPPMDCKPSDISDGMTADSDGQERRQRRFLSVADISDGRSDISDGTNQPLKTGTLPDGQERQRWPDRRQRRS